MGAKSAMVGGEPIKVIPTGDGRYLLGAAVDLPAPGEVLTDKVSVANAGTPVPLANVPTPIRGVVVKARKANTDLVYVVQKTKTGAPSGFELNPKDTVSLGVGDLADVVIDAAVNGEGVTYLAISVLED